MIFRVQVQLSADKDSRLSKTSSGTRTRASCRRITSLGRLTLRPSRVGLNSSCQLLRLVLAIVGDFKCDRFEPIFSAAVSVEIESSFCFKTHLKALVNEDTLLPMMFLGLPKLRNICCGHKMFLNKIRNIFCVCVSATNVARADKGGNICVATMCPQQCVLVCQGLQL